MLAQRRKLKVKVRTQVSKKAIAKVLVLSCVDGRVAR